MSMRIDTSTDRDAFPIIGPAALEAAARQRYGCHAWQLAWDSRVKLREELRAEEPEPASASDPEADERAERVAAAGRMHALRVETPECGCVAYEYENDQSSRPDPRTARIVHTCPGRDVRLVGLTYNDDEPAGGGYAVKVDDLGALGGNWGQDYEVDEYDTYSMAVYGRLVRELTRAQRVELLNRFDATQDAYATRASTARQLREMEEPCGCAAVGALLRDDGTRDFENLFLWHEDDCPTRAERDEEPETAA